MVGAMRTLGVAMAILGLGLGVAGLASGSEAERSAKQAELDAACEAARQEKLAVVRAQLVDECVEKKSPREDRASCERYYADYGSATPYQAALFYDLPECVKAFDYQTSYRRPEH